MTGAGGSRRQGGIGPIVTLALLIALCVLVLRHFDRTHPARPAPDGRRATRSSNPSPQGRLRPDAPRAPASPDEAPDDDWMPADNEARVAIVIDDVGFKEQPALDLARLDLPLTFAILPFQRHTHDLASLLRSSGHEIILHLPMEPMAFPARNPGPGAVSDDMRAADIAAAVRRALDDVPDAVGVNNHMGSKATADPAVMRAVLEVVRDRGLYFLDSRTGSGTVAYDLAVSMRIPALQRTVFLDDRRELSYIESQVRALIASARAEGTAVGIGHADRVTAEALRRTAGQFKSAAVRVVPASELAGLNRRGAR